MGVKPGYKQTEVGVIPDDWETVAVADLVEPSAPICYGVVQVGQHTESGVPIVAIKFVKEIAHAPLHRTVVHFEQPYARSRPKGGDVLISIKGTIGRVGIVPDGFKGNISRELARLRISDDFCPEYIAHQLESSATQERIMRSVVGTTRLEFSIATLRKFPLQVPPTLSEQRAITTALSDVDGLLGGLNRLIAKKRDLKQGAMQRLLTGQTRLPGFRGDWASKRLGDVATLNRQHVVPANLPSQMFVHFSLPAFDEGKTPVVELGSAIGSNKFRVPQGAVLVSKLNPRIPRVWAPKVIPKHSVASTEFLVLTPKEGTSRTFLFIVCASSRFCEQMEQAATGTTGSHQRVSPSGTLDIEVAIPVNALEQTAISKVLEDMDTELAALEQRRDKTRDLKQAMMQELLTGRTRLV